MTVRLRSVALPNEHGGWSLTLEPVVLGLVVAPTPSGWLLGAAALVAFVLRTPMRLVLVDVRRRRWIERSRVAARVAGVEGLALAALVAAAAAVTDHAFWEPLAVAGPFVLAAFAFDAFSRSRRLPAELVGSIGIAAVAAGIGFAGGEPRGLSYGLWVIAAARALASVGHVRVQVRRTKGLATDMTGSDAAQLVAVGAVGAAWIGGIVSLVATVAVAALALVHVVLVRCRPVAIPILGAQQVAFGLAVVLAASLGAVAP